MNDFTKEELIYKKWAQEEIFNDLMLQYDLLTSKEQIVNIPFQIISWCGNTYGSEMWNEENTEIEILMTGKIIFEGIRHCNFAESEGGYMNYPNLKQLSLCLHRLHELCIRYSWDYS